MEQRLTLMCTAPLVESQLRSISVPPTRCLSAPKAVQSARVLAAATPPVSSPLRWCLLLMTSVAAPLIGTSRPARLRQPAASDPGVSHTGRFLRPTFNKVVTKPFCLWVMKVSILVSDLRTQILWFSESYLTYFKIWLPWRDRVTCHWHTPSGNSNDLVKQSCFYLVVSSFSYHEVYNA